jgi:tetratricopeptide (TPR) repeat protein
MMDSEYIAQRIQGVFYQKVLSTIGTGTTARKTEKYVYYHAQQQDDGTVVLQSLGPDDAPFGKPSRISRDELLTDYLPDPQKSVEYARKQAGIQQEVQKAVARGDKFYKRGETFSAEFEYNKALSLDEENVRANFGVGLCFIARGETDKAREVFERLVTIEAAFADEHKHLFNDFGINLRKAGMQAEALAFYSRALELGPGDENLHYNMARAAYEMDDAQTASMHLQHCLAMSPKHEEARRFLDYLTRKGVLG